MATEFSTAKSIFVLAIVAGCFAILWPNVFYPMLMGSYTPQTEITPNENEHLRQERPPHLRPEFLHPALREKGRAIPQSHIVPKVKQQAEGRPGPLPGLRPPMGGAGHVVPPPKGSGTMGIVMPMYTIGIIVFFLYTMMRIIFKKSDSTNGYDGFSSDPEFHRAVFGEGTNRTYPNREVVEDSTKLDRTRGREGSG